jgi:fatty acid desaturase
MQAGPGPRNALERWFLPKLRDPRDLDLVRAGLALSAFAWTGALAFVALDLPAWAVLLWVPLVFAGRAGRATLLIHATSHRALFKPGHPILERWLPWAMGPFYGQTPGSFFVHHMGMHHPENNLEADQSSTLAYRRDRPGDFLHYWARFFFVGAPHLLRYLRLRRRDKLARRFLVGEGAWLAALGLLLLLRPVAAVGLLLVPMVLMRFFMMSGNWAQHAFVDLDDPDNAHRNSTCLTDARYNHNCFNDGYHIVHHLKPALHWTEMPGFLHAHLEQFGRQDAVVFSGVANNQVIWWWLMTQRWDRLAAHLVDLPGAPQRDSDAKIRFLQGRVRASRGARKGLLALEAAPAAR